MNFDDPFVKDALTGALKMLIIPFMILLIFIRLFDVAVGVQLGWQDLARGVAMAIFIYVIVMRQRYRRYFQ